MRSSWNIWEDPKSNDKCPSKRCAENREERRQQSDRRGRDCNDAATSHQKPKWQGTNEASREPQMTLALPPGVWTSGFQNCEGIRFYFSCHHVCDNLLLEPQEAAMLSIGSL